MEKVDPYNRKKSYTYWKNNGASFENISKRNSELIRNFIFDMEEGSNINGTHKKGGRSYARLLAYRSKLKFWAIQFEKKYNKNINQINRKQFHEVCNQLKRGEIKKANGGAYTHSADYIKSFKTFWHWLQKISQKQIDDITDLVDTPKAKPVWVYLNEKQYKQLANKCEFDYRILLLFMLDASIRVTEMKNVRANSFSENDKGDLFLTITDEVSKTIGRKIKLMITKDLIKEYIELKELKGDDLLFKKNVIVMNRYIKRKAEALFGKDNKSEAGELYSRMTLGDCRHISACYWLPKYPNPQGMMYRFAWKNPDKIYYYSEFLGMADNITEANMISDVDRSSYEKEIEALKKSQKDLKDFVEEALSKVYDKKVEWDLDGEKKLKPLV